MFDMNEKIVRHSWSTVYYFYMLSLKSVKVVSVQLSVKDKLKTGTFCITHVTPQLEEIKYKRHIHESFKHASIQYIFAVGKSCSFNKIT